MDQQLNQQENIAIMNSILVGYEYIECLDKIEQTKYYRQDIKPKVKVLIALLEKTNALKEIWGIEDTALMEMMRGKEELMKKIAPLRPELKFGLNMVLTQYFENPVSTLSKLGIDVEEN